MHWAWNLAGRPMSEPDPSCKKAISTARDDRRLASDTYLELSHQALAHTEHVQKRYADSSCLVARPKPKT